MTFLALCKFLLACSIGTSYVNAQCDSPPIIHNARNNITSVPPHPTNTTVQYQCEDGYNLSGTSSFYTCNGTTWKGGNFRCEEIFCSHVETPENGRMLNSPNYKVGTNVQFACDEGHLMSGQSTMMCQINGEWSPSMPPICTANDCGEFGSIQFANTFQYNSLVERNHYGSVVQVTCHDGKTLNGSSLVECQSDGQWGARPTCEALQCPSYANTNSPCISNSKLLGNYLYINCKNNVSTRFGPSKAECISGQWDNTEMGCLCDCIIPKYNSSFVTIDNLNVHGNIPHLATLGWKCAASRIKSPSLSIMCFDGVLKAQDDLFDVNTYTVPSDFNNVIIPQLCILPDTSILPHTTSPATTSSPMPATTSSPALLPTIISSINKTSATLPQTYVFTTTQYPSTSVLSTSLTTTLLSKATTMSQGHLTKRSSTMPIPVSLSSGLISHSSTVSLPLQLSTDLTTHTSTTQLPTMSLPVQLSTDSTTQSPSVTQGSTESTPVQLSTDLTTQTSTTQLPTISLPVQLSTDSTTQSTIMSIPVQLSTNSTIQSPSVTQASTVSTLVQLSTDLTTQTSTTQLPTMSTDSSTQSTVMSVPVQLSTNSTIQSPSVTQPSTVLTPVPLLPKSITQPSIVSTSVPYSSESITQLTTVSTLIPSSPKSIVQPSTVSSTVSVSSEQMKSSSEISSSVVLSSQIKSTTPSFKLSLQFTPSLAPITSSSTTSPTTTFTSQSTAVSPELSPHVSVSSKSTKLSSKESPLNTLSTQSTTASIVSTTSSLLTLLYGARRSTATASSSNSTILTAPTSTAGSYSLQNTSSTGPLHNGDVNDTTSSRENNSTTTQNENINANAAAIKHIGYLHCLNICCFSYLLNMIRLKL